ncbi:hypothetical protein KC887_04815 [Candidatus Kaiserbacteria bacterium]|nr:hypothetical protein [Candidatus Kaiserbacteria bacterium]
MSTAQAVLALLDVVKTEPGGVYRCNSPFHAGSNSEAFVLKIDDDEHGTFYNHAAKAGEPEGGTLYELARALGADITVGRTQVENTKRQYAGLDDYASMQGVSPEVFKAAGWEETTHMRRPALTFPTRKGDIKQMRWRFLDGDKPHYINPGGYQVCWYGLDRAIQKATEDKTPIVLCNGEASTVVAQHFGLPAFCKTAGENKIPDDLLAELESKWRGEIIIALDCDDKGRHVAQAVKEQLSNAYVIDLGLTDGGDLANFCKLHTTEVAPALWRLKNKAVADTPVSINAQPLAQSLSELTKALKDNRDDIGDYVNRAQHQLDIVRSQVFRPPVLTQNQIITQAAMNFAERVGRDDKSGIVGLRSGIRTIDFITKGFRAGTITSIIASTHQGKSTLVTSIIPALMTQAPGLIVSTETDPERYLNKIITSGLNIPVDKVNNGTCTPDEAKAIYNAYGLFRQREADWMEKRSPYLSDIKTALDAGKGKYKWLIVDSLSNLNSTLDGIYARTSQNSKGIVEIAGDYGVAVLQTVQIGRAQKSSEVKIPSINDAKGAGDIEEDADLMIALYNHHHYVSIGEANADEKFPEGTGFIRVLKDRWNGMTGYPATLAFVGGCRFADYTPDAPINRYID